MFELYTERARRVVFFARYEASAYGSSTIEPEHLLLGILREDKPLIHRFLPNTFLADVRGKIEEHITAREKISTSIDLPLSNECKRILAYAHEESERLAHRHIGTEHLLLGILREQNCLAARLLVECGIMNLDAARADLAESPGDSGTPPEVQYAPAERSSIHALVDRLPESALGRAHWMLEQLL
jgi:ATP-dependent Clp protease ATP-binding subunit ClpC